jgi:hypothetical protein
MIISSEPSGLSIIASLFIIAAVLSVIRFRKKVRLIRSLSDNRDLDVYVPYNLLFYGCSQLNSWPQTGMAFPYDQKNEAVIQELKNSWLISLTLVLTIWFALGTGFFVLISYIYK